MALITLADGSVWFGRYAQTWCGVRSAKVITPARDCA